MMDPITETHWNLLAYPDMMHYAKASSLGVFNLATETGCPQKVQDLL